MGVTFFDGIKAFPWGKVAFVKQMTDEGNGIDKHNPLNKPDKTCQRPLISLASLDSFPQGKPDYNTSFKCSAASTICPYRASGMWGSSSVSTPQGV